VTEPASDAELDARLNVYWRLPVRLGLGDVSAQRSELHCLRPITDALPLNAETYTYTTTGGRRWTWDVDCARALVAGRSASERLVLEPDKVATCLADNGHVDEAHLAHVPIDRFDEPVLLAPVPSGHGQVFVDGAHRATVRIRNGLPVQAMLLTPAESLLAIEIVPLVRRQIATSSVVRVCYPVASALEETSSQRAVMSKKLTSWVAALETRPAAHDVVSGRSEV
jgi:hypothetical protein